MGFRDPSASIHATIDGTIILDDASKPPTAAQIGAAAPVPPSAAAIGTAVGGAVPVPPSAAAIGGAVPVPPSAVSIGTQVGISVPVPPSAAAVATAGYNSGSRVVDTPVELLNIQQLISGPVSAQAAGGYSSAVVDASLYHSIQIHADIFNAAGRGDIYCALAIRWFADGGATLLLHESIVELTQTASAGGSDTNQVFITDRCHAKWLQIGIQKTAGSNTNGEVDCRVFGSSRGADRFRVNERLTNIPAGGIAFGTDGVLLAAPAVACLANATTVFGVAALYAGECSLFVAPTFASGASPGDLITLTFGSLGVAAAAFPVPANGKLYQYVVLPRRPVKVSYFNSSTTGPVTMNAIITASEY